MSIKQIFEKYLENFFGILIALNIIHQIQKWDSDGPVSSGGVSPTPYGIA